MSKRCLVAFGKSCFYHKGFSAPPAAYYFFTPAPKTTFSSYWLQVSVSTFASKTIVAYCGFLSLIFESRPLRRFLGYFASRFLCIVLKIFWYIQLIFWTVNLKPKMSDSKSNI